MVDPRLAAGRGEDYRIEAVRQRQLEEIELQRLDDGDFRCAGVHVHLEVALRPSGHVRPLTAAGLAAPGAHVPSAAFP